jgi:hypothetical protein
MKEKQKTKIKEGQCWVETKSGKLVRIVEPKQNGLVRYDSLVGIGPTGIPNWHGYYAHLIGEWHRDFSRA